MISAPLGLWLLAAVAALALAGILVEVLRRASRRRARRASYARAANESHLIPLASEFEPAPTGINPEHAAIIRSHAEKSAQHDWAAGHGTERSPYDRGTPQHVLWFATYHLRISELAEEAEAEVDALSERREAAGGSAQ